MPTPEVCRLIRKQFDAELVFDLYMTKSDINLVFEHFLPLVWIVMLSEFKGLTDDIQEDLVSVSMISLYEVTLSRKCEALGRCGSLNEFIMWHYNIIRSRMFSKFAEDRIWNERRLTKYGIDVPPMPGPWHRELDIYLSQLPRELENLVMERVRFEGNGYLACQYILRCILRKDRIVEGVIKHELRQANVRFFIDYVLVLLRVVLYSLKGGVPLGIIRQYSNRNTEPVAEY